MKKAFFLFFIGFFLISCSSNNDDASASPFNPPSWIQGTWGEKANVANGQAENPIYRFTNDNICQIITSSYTNCWKESIQQDVTKTLSGNDTKTDDTYTVRFISGGGATTLTLSFKKVSSTRILWINTGNGDFPLDKLN